MTELWSFFAIPSKKEQIGFIQNYTHTQLTSPNPKKANISVGLFFLIFCSPQETSVKVKNLVTYLSAEF